MIDRITAPLKQKLLSVLCSPASAFRGLMSTRRVWLVAFVLYVFTGLLSQLLGTTSITWMLPFIVWLAVSLLRCSKENDNKVTYYFDRFASVVMLFLGFLYIVSYIQN
jgi:hypothetical protein